MSLTRACVASPALADVRRDRGPNTISRENVQRKVVVMCNVAERDLAAVVENIDGRSTASVSLPPGYRVEYGGGGSRARRRHRGGSCCRRGGHGRHLADPRPGSVRDAILMPVNLPLGLVGGVVGVYLSGGVVSVASLIGFLTLFGIATRNGLMKVMPVHRLVRVESVEDIATAATAFGFARPGRWSGDAEWPCEQSQQPLFANSLLTTSGSESYGPLPFTSWAKGGLPHEKARPCRRCRR